ELLEREQTDRLLAQCALVTDLRRLEQAGRILPEAIGRHPSADVVDRDDGAPALAPQEDPDPLAPSPGFGVLVGGVRHELVERILRILVRLTRDQDRLGEVPDPQTDPLTLAGARPGSPFRGIGLVAPHNLAHSLARNPEVVANLLHRQTGAVEFD